MKPGSLSELREMIKFQHSLFALPFAFTSVLVAADGLPPWRVLLLVVACMVAARTAAMTFNRIVDRRFDAANPRTAQRALPAGRVSLAGAWTLFAVATAAFLVAAACINRVTAWLAPAALVVILGYSLAKRVTPATHALLGLALSIAPLGAWLAVRGRFDPEVLLLCLGVLSWTAGFDMLYACQDVDFDRKAGLHSLPARIGVRRSLHVSTALHAFSVAALAGFGYATHLGWPYFAALAGATALLAWSHGLVRPDDLSRVGVAFFEVNVGVSMLVLAGTAVDVLLRR